MPNNFLVTYENISLTSQKLVTAQKGVASVAVEMTKGQASVQMQQGTAV